MATEAISPIHCPGCETVYDPSTIDATEMAFCHQCRFPLSLIAGKYRLERLLNQGGFGMLYLARHVGLEMFNERVIKVLKPELFSEPDVLRRFRREVQLTANLSEQNNHIVRIYDDFGEAPGLGQYYIMEYLRGLTLDAMQGERQSLDYELCFHIFFQLCRAMGASHRAGVIHRDLKPDNIFLIQRDADPHFVKVIDFGLARPTEGSTQIKSFATQQQVMGTPAYMSPEQCQGEDIDNRSDIYAMGILLYQMLTGHHPYPIAPSDTMALFFAHISGEPTPLEKYLPQAAHGLGDTVLKAMAKAPEDRYPDADAFWQALAPYAHGATSQPPMTNPGHAVDNRSLDPMAFQATAAVVPAVSPEHLEAIATGEASQWQTPAGSLSAEAVRNSSSNVHHSGAYAPTDQVKVPDVEVLAPPRQAKNAGPEALAPTDQLKRPAPDEIAPTEQVKRPEPNELLEAQRNDFKLQPSDVIEFGPTIDFDSLVDDDDDDDDQTFIAGAPASVKELTEDDTDDAQLVNPVPRPFEKTLDGTEDGSSWLDEDEDDSDATAISTFTPPTMPPELRDASTTPVATIQPESADTDAHEALIPDDAEPDEDETGDTAISVFTPPKAPPGVDDRASLKEIKAISELDFKAIRREGAPPNRARPANVAATTRTPMSEEVLALATNTSSAAPSRAGLGVWFVVGIAVLGIVGVGVWLLTRV